MGRGVKSLEIMNAIHSSEGLAWFAINVASNIKWTKLLEFLINYGTWPFMTWDLELWF